MKTILTLVFSIITLTVHGQITVKLYQNIDYSVNPTRKLHPWNDYYSTSVLSFSRLSLGVQFGQKKKYFHEIELSYAQKAIPVVHYIMESDYVTTDKNYVGIQYEISRFLTNPDNRLRLSFGVGALAYYLVDKRMFDPGVGYYNHGYRYGGVTMNLIPRLVYKISNKLTAEISGKLGLCDTRLYQWHVNNPTLPDSQLTTTTTEFGFFPHAYTFRIGMGYKF